MMSQLKRCSLLLLAVALYSTDNIVLKSLPKGTSPIGILVVACGLAIPLLTFFFRKHLHTRISWRQHALIALVALGFTLLNFLNITSLKYIGVNDSAFIFSLTVALVPAINLLFGKRAPWFTWVGVVVIVGGVWFASGITYSNTEILGYVISFSGALVRALFLIGLNHATQQIDNKRVLVELVWFVALWAAIGWMLQDPTGLIRFDYSLKTLGPIIAFSLLSIVIGNSILIVVQKYSTAVETAIILSVQLVFTLLLMSVVPTFLELPEPLTLPHVIGCLLIVCGSILATCDFNEILQKGKKGSA